MKKKYKKLKSKLDKSSNSDDNSKSNKKNKSKKDKKRSDNADVEFKSKRISRKCKESPLSRSVDENDQLLGANTNRMNFYPQHNGPFRYPNNVNQMGGV